MPYLKSKDADNTRKLPFKTKNLFKVHKQAQPVMREEELVRFNDIANRARRSFHNDGPGGSYEGF